MIGNYSLFLSCLVSTVIVHFCLILHEDSWNIWHFLTGPSNPRQIDKVNLLDTYYPLKNWGFGDILQKDFRVKTLVEEAWISTKHWYRIKAWAYYTISQKVECLQYPVFYLNVALIFARVSSYLSAKKLYKKPRIQDYFSISTRTSQRNE